MKKFFPTPAAVTAEALAVLLGAVIAAAVLGQFPALKKWLKDQAA